MREIMPEMLQKRLRCLRNFITENEGQEQRSSHRVFVPPKAACCVHKFSMRIVPASRVINVAQK